MKRVFFILICLLTFTNLYSQSPIELEQARMLKDKGEVNAAIDMYKEFIKQYKNNLLHHKSPMSSNDTFNQTYNTMRVNTLFLLLQIYIFSHGHTTHHHKECFLGTNP